MSYCTLVCPGLLFSLGVMLYSEEEMGRSRSGEVVEAVRTEQGETLFGMSYMREGSILNKKKIKKSKCFISAVIILSLAFSFILYKGF